jgi:hypothetical protein
MINRFRLVEAGELISWRAPMHATQFAATLLKHDLEN